MQSVFFEFILGQMSDVTRYLDDIPQLSPKGRERFLEAYALVL